MRFPILNLGYYLSQMINNALVHLVILRRV